MSEADDEGRAKVTLFPGMRKALGGGGARAEQKSDVVPVDIQEDEWVEGEIDRQSWLAPGVLMRGSVTLLSGAPSAGKSLICLGYAVACALGLKWGNFRPVSRLRVGLYNAEDDHDEQKRRLSATLRQHGKEPRDLSGYLKRLHPQTSPVLLRWGMDESGSFRLVPTEAMQWIIDECLEKSRQAKVPLDVLFLDPMVELHNAPENDNVAQRFVLAFFRTLAQRYHLAIVLVHHSRKGTSEMAGNPDTARGASAIIGACRTVLTCSTMTAPEAASAGLTADLRHQFCRVDGAKSNYFRNGSEEWYEKTVYDLDNGDTVAAMVPWQPPNAASQDQVVLMDLAAAVARGIGGEPFSAKLSNDARSIKFLFHRHGIEGKKAEKEALSALWKMGIHQAEYQTSNRYARNGLRDARRLPAVKWLDDPAEGASMTASTSDETASETPKIASMQDQEELDWNF